MAEFDQHKTEVVADPAPLRPAQRSGYLPTLDGWRAIAILWVLEAHSRVWTYGQFSNSWIHNTGYRGVQVFFALSGFLICTRLLREEDRFGSISLRSFYTRRLFRIQPAAMTYLGAVVILTLCGVIPVFWPGIGGAVFMVRNIWPSNLAPGYWYTSHFWSLAVEEHFYLLLPGFLVLVRRNRLVILLAMAFLLEIWRQVVLQTAALQNGELWQVDQRTDVVLGGILLGSVVAVALTHQRLLELAKQFLRPWVAFLYTAAVFWILEHHHSSIVGTTLITVYPLLIVATVLHGKSWTGRFLELAPVRFIGRISYSLYLWQQFFLNPEEAAKPHTLQSHVVFCLCATVACAVASFYLIETPLIRIGHRIAKKFDLQEAAAKEKHALVS
jgi:peptidoglycan/LPS O-acetylase OafA/YrhL